MAEKQQEHRQELEKKALHAKIASERRGQVLGAFIIAGAIAAGTYLIKIDKKAEGLTSILGGIATPAALFIYGKRREDRELASKSGR